METHIFVNYLHEFSMRSDIGAFEITHVIRCADAIQCSIHEASHLVSAYAILPSDLHRHITIVQEPGTIDARLGMTAISIPDVVPSDTHLERSRVFFTLAPRYFEPFLKLYISGRKILHIGEGSFRYDDSDLRETKLRLRSYERIIDGRKLNYSEYGETILFSKKIFKQHRGHLIQDISRATLHVLDMLISRTRVLYLENLGADEFTIKAGEWHNSIKDLPVVFRVSNGNRLRLKANTKIRRRHYTHKLHLAYRSE